MQNRAPHDADLGKNDEVAIAVERWVRQPIRARAVASTATGIAVASCVAVVPLHRWVASQVDIAPLSWSDLVLGAVWPVAGAVVISARPRNAVGWLLLSAGFIGPYLLLGTLAAWSQLARTDPLPLTDLATWISIWGFAPYLFVVPLVLLLFPDGRPASDRWRTVVTVVGVVSGITIATRMFSPVGSDVADDMRNPVGWLPDGSQIVTRVGAFFALLVGSALGVLSLLIRSRRATGVERTQLQWLALGGVVLLAGATASLFGEPGGGWSEAAFAAGLVGPPAAVAVAVVRHRLFDVEFALNRTVVYVVLSGAAVVAYLATVVAIGGLTTASTRGALLVAVAAVVGAAGRSGAQVAVDRWLFGHRRDPYAVVAHVGRDVARGNDPAEALERLVDALREALRLPYAAYIGATTIESGAAVAGWHSTSVVCLGQHLGELRAGRRRPGERLSEQEQAAISEVADRAGTLAYALTLVDDVAQSRARIVAAREEERRRLRADLHDGVGPSLAGTALQMEALAKRLANQDEYELSARADEIRDRLRGTVQDIRAVVHGLRPPILDQVGLGGALRGLVAGLDVPSCSVLLPDDVDQLPASIEVAAYAIAAEAVSNALRHSAASRLQLTLAWDGDQSVQVEITDDGCGLPSRPAAGVGLTGMADRAREVGGRFELLVRPGGGTIVRATLPRSVPA